MTLRDIERVLYFEAYVVTDPGMTPLKKFSIMSEDDYDAKRREFGDEFTARIGLKPSSCSTGLAASRPRSQRHAPARP